MINFFQKRFKAYAISAALLITGAILIYQKGIKKGIDFTGGSSFVVAFQVSPNVEAIKSKLKKIFNNQSTEVKTYGSPNVLLVTTSYLLDKNDQKKNQTVKNILIKAIVEATGGTYGEITQRSEKKFIIRSMSNKSASVQGNQAQALFISLLSLFMMFLYLLLRFRKWQFSLATMIALIHDFLAVIASFAIAREFGTIYPIDQAVLGSLIAGVGISCNNSVVINDRHRSLLKELGQNDLKKTGNLAIHQTIGRTIMTSLTTLVAVACLFIFGGEALKSISFSMIISILVGTYSSFFVLPLAYDLIFLTQKIKKYTLRILKKS